MHLNFKRLPAMTNFYTRHVQLAEGAVRPYSSSKPACFIRP